MNLRFRSNADEVAAAWRDSRLGFAAMLSGTMNETLTAFGRETRYPPPSSVPSYSRTFTLQRSLAPGSAQHIQQVSVKGYTIQGDFGSRVGYSSYVIGPPDKPGKAGGQAWMHKGRWWTLVDKMAAFLPRATAHFKDKITQYLGRLT